VNFGQRIDTDIHAKNAQLRTNGVTCELLINQSSNTVSLVNRTRVDLEELNVRVVSGISCEAAE
jgi:hypothetical protein